MTRAKAQRAPSVNQLEILMNSELRNWEEDASRKGAKFAKINIILISENLAPFASWRENIRGICVLARKTLLKSF